MPRLAPRCGCSTTIAASSGSVQAPGAGFVLDRIALDVIVNAATARPVWANRSTGRGRLSRRTARLIFEGRPGSAPGFGRQGRDGGMTRTRLSTGAAGGADAPLPAAVPLLLQPGGAGAGRPRAGHRDLAARDRRGRRSRRLQIHFSGGEPTVRKDLEELVRTARGGPLPEPHHRRRPGLRGAAGRRSPRPASTMSS